MPTSPSLRARHVLASCPLNCLVSFRRNRYKEYRVKQEKLHADWLERKKERDAKIARGEEVEPEEPDPTYEPEIGVLGLLKFVVCLLLFVVLLGKFVTGDFLWGYDGKWTQLKTYWPVRIHFMPLSKHELMYIQQGEGRLFSEAGLARYDGSNPDIPLYLAVRCSYNLLPRLRTARSMATFTTSPVIAAFMARAALTVRCT